MTEALLFMLGIGGLCGVVLSFASKIFYVYEDPRIAEVENSLAGANCGGCGYAGCSSAAQAVVAGQAPPNVCVISSPEGVAQVAGIMGMDPGTAEPQLSYSMCDGGNRAANQYHYMGVNSCSAMALMYGGQRQCQVGCLGLGDCIKACKFGAVFIGQGWFSHCR